MQEVKPLPALLESDLVEIPGDKKNRFLLREDVEVLNSSAESNACDSPAADSSIPICSLIAKKTTC